MKHILYGTKPYSLQEVKAWYEGESDGLKGLIGVGYYSHLFVASNGLVRFFYDHDEWKKVNRKINDLLTKDFFDMICTEYNILLTHIKIVSTNQEIHELAVKLCPIQTIFNEIDECPKIASKYILDKLLKIRKHLKSSSVFTHNNFHPILSIYQFQHPHPLPKLF